MRARARRARGDAVENVSADTRGVQLRRALHVAYGAIPDDAKPVVRAFLLGELGPVLVHSVRDGNVLVRSDGLATERRVGVQRAAAAVCIALLRAPGAGGARPRRPCFAGSGVEYRISLAEAWSAVERPGAARTSECEYISARTCTGQSDVLVRTHV